MKQPLARVVDPDALDASDGTRARLRLEIPRNWAETGAKLLVSMPKRVSCARCDGGGCDGCGRTGAFTIPACEDARTIRFDVPEGQRGSFVLRLTHPFDDVPLDQLHLEIVLGEAASPCVERVHRYLAPVEPRASAGRLALPTVAVLVVIAGLVGALLAVLR